MATGGFGIVVPGLPTYGKAPITGPPGGWGLIIPGLPCFGHVRTVPPIPPSPDIQPHPSLLPIWGENTHDRHRLATQEEQRRWRRRRKDEEDLIALGLI